MTIAPIARSGLVRISGSLPQLDHASVATIGNFDGVHRGHQELLSRVVAKAKNLSLCSTVISFYPHPRAVLQGISDPPAVTPLRRQLALFSECGIEQVILIHFTSAFSKLSAEQFVERYLCQQLKVHHLVVGSDARVGAGGTGDVTFLQSHFAREGRTLEVVDDLRESGERISSGRVKQCLAQGDIAAAEQLLGAPFLIESRVLQGAQRGRTLSFPTANQSPQGQLLPKFGVYVTELFHQGRYHNAVTNVGLRPTFGHSTPVVESHIIEPGEYNLYGARVKVRFLSYLRPEMRFSGVESLQSQIAKDIEVAKLYHADRARLPS